MNKQNYQLKILQLTDLHWSQDFLINKNSKKMISRIAMNFRPDLIVITGDLLHDVCFKNPIAAIDDIIRTFDELRIPWTFVFGNHEREYKDFSISDLAKYITKNSKYVLFNDFRINDRVGNYRLVIPTKKAYVNLFFLDSGGHEIYEDKPSYSWITPEQISWVDKEINQIKNKNDKDSIYLFFQHIPVPEYKDLIDKKVAGDKNEEVSSPIYNSGFYKFLKEKLPNNKKFMFVGHDHYNDYIINDDDFVLCYGRQTGFYKYDPSLTTEQQINGHEHNEKKYDDNYLRGARFFEIKSDFILIGRIFEEYKKITDYTNYL